MRNLTRNFFAGLYEPMLAIALHEYWRAYPRVMCAVSGAIRAKSVSSPGKKHAQPDNVTVVCSSVISSPAASV